MIFDQFFRQKPTFFDFFSSKNEQILDQCQNLLKIIFFARKRCGGVCICPKGLISTKIFALALTTHISISIFTSSRPSVRPWVTANYNAISSETI